MGTKGNQVQGKKTTLVGLVEVFGQEVYITENWDSRSRVSYKVEGRFNGQLKKLEGRIVSVEGVMAKKNPWSGTIKVEKIFSVRELKKGPAFPK